MTPLRSAAPRSSGAAPAGRTKYATALVEGGTPDAAKRDDVARDRQQRDEEDPCHCGCATARETTAVLAVTTMRMASAPRPVASMTGIPATSDPQKIGCHGEHHERAQTDSAMGPLRKGEMRFASASDRVSVATSASASTTASRRCFRSTSTMGGPN
jgi:hypothetical protein